MLEAIKSVPSRLQLARTVFFWFFFALVVSLIAFLTLYAWEWPAGLSAIHYWICCIATFVGALAFGLYLHNRFWVNDYFVPFIEKPSAVHFFQGSAFALVL